MRHYFDSMSVLTVPINEMSLRISNTMRMSLSPFFNIF